VKQTLNITRSKDPKRVKVGMSFEFDADDPRAARIYRGIGLCLKEAFTPAEAEQFLRKFETATADPRGARRRLVDALKKTSADPGCKLCYGTGKLDRGNGSTKPCPCAKPKGGA